MAPADAAGLREGDVLIGIGSYTLQNLAQLQGVVAAKRLGDSIPCGPGGTARSSKSRWSSPRRRLRLCQNRPPPGQLAPDSSLRERFTPGELLIGGHRGNPAEYPENTLASFASAIEIGVEVIECDVHLTSDGRLAVIHDHTLDRTTTGKGPVGARTMAELKKLDAGGGQRIPELSEVLELAHGKVGVAIEVKSLPVKYPRIEEKLVKALHDADMARDSAVISFDHRVVRRVRELSQDVVGGVLVAGRPLMLPELLRWADAEVYSPHWSFVDSETVAEVHRAGAVIGVWTVDDEETLARCQALGVDAVYTNRPRQLLEAMASVVTDASTE